MPDPRSAPDDRPNIGSEPLEEELRALAGEEPADEQDGALDPDEIESREELTMTELDRLETRSSDPADLGSVDGLAAEGLRDGETDDPEVAAQEGLTWVPPTDPPFVVSDDPNGIAVAAGLGSSALDDPYDDDHRAEDLSAESELNARIREAIRADAATSGYAERIVIGTIGSTAILRGVIDDLNDADDLVAVVERVKGIDEVRDETEVAGLG
ncbi:MAG TPA: BON domain-containing protein [Candidatus Limnocylindrales bacterium]